MNTQDAIKELRNICIEEAAHFNVPPVLPEILLVKTMFKSRKRHYLIPEFLKSGALFRMLVNWNGSYDVLLDKGEPTIEFKDGTIIGENFDHRNPAVFRWDTLIHIVYIEITPSLRDEISKKLQCKVLNVFNLIYN